VRGEQGPETNHSFTIQQVARLTGLSEYTLRYYERIGLIDRVSRDDSSGHRRYDSRNWLGSSRWPGCARWGWELRRCGS
jgi:hypothetical protein